MGVVTAVQEWVNGRDPDFFQFWADGTSTPLVEVHHTRGQLHRKRRGGSQPKISKAGYLSTRPRLNIFLFFFNICVVLSFGFLSFKIGS